jgi:AcrR family transcriptional regulator
MAATAITPRRGTIPLDVGRHAQRARLVAAMSEVAAERGWAAAGVEHVCRHAGMSRRTYYNEFAGLEECYVEAVSQAFDRLCATVRDAVLASGVAWADRVSTAVTTLLATLDADPVLARLCVIEPVAGSRGALAVRRRAVQQLAALMSEGSHQRDPVPDGTALATIGAVWALAHERLVDHDRDRGTLGDVVAPAVYLALVPYVGPDTALAYAERACAGLGAADAPSRPSIAAPPPAMVRVTTLTRSTLLYLDEHPGARNRDIADAISVAYESQISRHLARLEHQGMLQRERNGRSNAWTLTAEGRRTAKHLRRPEPPIGLAASAARMALHADGGDR